MTRWLRLLPWLLCLSCVLGCQRAGPPQSEGDDAVVVDSTLLAFLSRARSAHHLADLAEEEGRIDGAVEPLRALVTGPVPGGDRPEAIEVREVLADTRARLADLESRRGQFDQAERDVEAGLLMAEARNYFRGHLFEVRGLVEERRGTALQAAGNTVEASRAKQRALEAFEESMEIQAEVIRKAVPDTEGGP